MTSDWLPAFYSLCFVLTFDMILLVSMMSRYRVLHFTYLKLGAAAMAVEMLIQCVFFTASAAGLTALFSLGGIGRIVYSMLVLSCVSHVMRRPLPFKWMLAWLLMYLSQSIFVSLTGVFGPGSWFLVELPNMVLNLTAVWFLLSTKQPRTLGTSWLGGLIGLHLFLQLSLPFFLGNSILFPLLYFYDAVVVMMMGAVTVMISSEGLLSSLGSQSLALEEKERENRRLTFQFSQAQKLESLGALAGGIAHDFNNMLTSILGYAGVAMKKLEADSEVRKDLYMVMSGARQAVDLTAQMLVYAGKGASGFQPLDLARAVDDMTAQVDSIVPRKIQLEHHVVRGLPVMKGDPVQIGQVLMNLIANAVDAIETDSGVIEIATGLAEVDDRLLRESFFAGEREKGAYLFLRVKDSGIGFDVTKTENIFDPFYHGKSARRGLGLASLSGIVRQHKGFINVISRTGEGAQFTVYFPAVSVMEKQSMSFETLPRDSSGRRIVLVADDDLRIRGLVTAILEDEGFEVMSVGNGREVVDKIEQMPETYNLFVLDCTMPMLSGPAVYQQIRAAGIDTPIILMSGYNQNQLVIEISDDSRAYFIKKPFDVDDLLNCVAQALADPAETDLGDQR